MAYTGMHRWRDHLWQKKNPFRMPSINNWYLFHIYPVSNFSSPLNCCKCIVFKTWINHKTRTYCRLFHNNKIYLLAIWAFLQTEKTDFPTLLLTSTGEIPIPFHIPEVWKRYPRVLLYMAYTGMCRCRQGKFDLSVLNRVYNFVWVFQQGVARWID